MFDYVERGNSCMVDLRLHRRSRCCSIQKASFVVMLTESERESKTAEKKYAAIFFSIFSLRTERQKKHTELWSYCHFCPFLFQFQFDCVFFCVCFTYSPIGWQFIWLVMSFILVWFVFLSRKIYVSARARTSTIKLYACGWWCFFCHCCASFLVLLLLLARVVCSLLSLVIDCQ